MKMIYAIPFIAALIGWFTNLIAVKMLFRPRKKVRILFWDIQGIFPKRQQILAEKIGKMVADELFNIDDIKKNIHDPENISQIHYSIEEKVDSYLNEEFKKNYPMVSLFVSKKMKGKIREDIMYQVKDLTPEMIDNYLNHMEGTLDVEVIIKDKVNLLSPEKLENLIMSILKKEFTFIELIGALIGFMVGLLQILLIQL